MEVHEGARIAPVRSFFDYYTRGALDACIGLMDRDVRFVPLAGSGHVFDGRSAVRRFFDDARRDGVTLEPRAHRFLDCGPDCVVAAGTLRELRSGQLRERTVAWLFVLSEGRIALLEGFPTLAAALDAAAAPTRAQAV